MAKKVYIPFDEIVRAGRGDDAVASPEQQERYVLDRLRNGGIPVQGIRTLVGLEHGTLSIRRDDFGYTYRWTAGG